MKKVTKIFIFIISIVSISIFFTVSIGAIVRHSSLDGPHKDKFLFKTVFYLASLPSNIKFRLTEMEIVENKNLKPGFHFSNHSNNRDYFMLLSRFDLEKNRSVIELISTKTQETLYTWLPNIDEYNEISNFENESEIDTDFKLHASTKRHRLIHPLLLEDGSIITQSDSPLIRFNCKSELMWQSDLHYHHSNELDKDNNVVVSSKKYNSKLQKEFGTKNFFIEDLIHIVDIKNGNIIYTKSIFDILRENDLYFLLDTEIFMEIDSRPWDVLHTNDLQPVLYDTNFFKKGDIFISARHISTVFLYRPSTNKIIWYSQGPWRWQHDVDIIDEETIGIFNNNNPLVNQVSEYQKSVSQVVYYNFRTKKYSLPYKRHFRENNIMTKSDGLFTVMSNGDLFYEENLKGRIYLTDINGNILFKYIAASHLNWARLIEDKEFIAKVLKNLKKQKCI